MPRLSDAKPAALSPSLAVPMTVEPRVGSVGRGVLLCLLVPQNITLCPCLGRARGQRLLLVPCPCRGAGRRKMGSARPGSTCVGDLAEEKRLREGIGVAPGSVGGAPPSCVSPPWAAAAVGRVSEWATLCASGQDWAMGPGSGSPEMAARGNLAPRPPRPPPPRGSPALRAGPPRPSACLSRPSKQHQVPAPREAKHPPVRGPTAGDVG